jgi:hypothetical protein
MRWRDRARVHKLRKELPGHSFGVDSAQLGFLIFRSYGLKVRFGGELGLAHAAVDFGFNFGEVPLQLRLAALRLIPAGRVGR